jgi:hypothetical protein
MQMQRGCVKSVVQADTNAVDAQIDRFRNPGNDVEQLRATSMKGSMRRAIGYCAEILTDANRQMDRPAFTGSDGVRQWRVQRSSAERGHPGEDRSFDRDGPSRQPACTDLDGKTFRWHWPNVPFAAICSDDEGREVKPPRADRCAAANRVVKVWGNSSRDEIESRD